MPVRRPPVSSGLVTAAASSLPPPPIGMQPAPFAMAGAVLAEHDSEADAGLAIASLAELMEAHHLRLARALCRNGSAEPPNARHCTCEASDCKQRLVPHFRPSLFKKRLRRERMASQMDSFVNKRRPKKGHGCNARQRAMQGKQTKKVPCALP